MTLQLSVAAVGAALALLGSASRAQCNDPGVPAGGFALTASSSVVNFSDGASTGADVYHPAPSPGSCGWPVVVVVHPLGASRQLVSGLARRLASRGYLTIAYDVRGQGSSVSSGSHLIGGPERLDLAEIVGWLGSQFAGLADINRLGITGISQGGIHSWAAAAWSGRTLPTNNRGITTFPVFRAAYPIVFSAFEPEVLAPMDRAFSPEAVQIHTGLFPVTLDPAYLGQVMPLLQAGNFSGFANLHRTDPFRMDPALLATSAVPVMAHVQWNDEFMPVDLALSQLAAMPSTTPTRAFLSTFNFHQEPFNARQEAQSFWYAERWFDRFLKGIANGVDREPRVVTGVIPKTLAAYQSSSSLLWNRHHDRWPPPAATPLRYYLRQGGLLDPAAPTGPEPPDPLVHTVSGSASMAAFIAARGNIGLIENWIPLQSVVYDGPTLSAPIEIAGSPRIELEVDPSGPRYQVHCALYQVHGNGAERYLQSGIGLVLGNAGSNRLTIDFADLNVVLQTGEHVRLKVQNLTKRFPAGAQAFSGRPFNYRTIPYFQSVTLQLVHTAARPSWFELPVLDEVRPALVSSVLDVSVLQPRRVPFRLEGTSNLAGSPYLLVFGVSGMAPGTTVLAEHFLLNSDLVTGLSFTYANSPILPGSLGTLGGTGSASPALDLSTFPGIASLLGVRMIGAAAVGAPQGLRASDPVEVLFR